MAESLYIDTSEILKLSTKLKGMEKTVASVVDDVLTDNAHAIALKAKDYAPVNLGGLQNSISADTAKVLEKHITVNANYAAYVEFGTGKYAAQYVSTLPATWKEFALKFKGKTGGSFDELLENIYKWVKANKIGATYNVQTRKRTKMGRQSAETTDRATAYFIAISIIRNGIHPHPFLFPAYEQQRGQIVKDVETVLKAL